MDLFQGQIQALAHALTCMDEGGCPVEALLLFTGLSLPLRHKHMQDADKVPELLHRYRATVEHGVAAALRCMIHGAA
eukprot:1060068-Pelagomonas_calceolata.AAC.1